MKDQFSFQELYDFSLKTTSNMKIGNHEFEPGETVAFFDKIQIANFKELDSLVAAQGGFENQMRVIWQKTEGVTLDFSQGIFNEAQFAFLVNARLLYREEDLGIAVPKREVIESSDYGEIILSQIPIEGSLFIYEEGEKVLVYELEDNVVYGLEPFTTYLIDYFYTYKGSGENVLIGRRLIDGPLKAYGKTKVKDDVTGLVRTGIIKIPKFKLLSDLSMTLGSKANPVNGKLKGIALPWGDRGNSHCIEFITLSDDIDSDM